MALVGQDVEDGRQPLNSQQEEEVQLPELSASRVDQTGGQGVEESRQAVVHVLVRGRKRGSENHVHLQTSKEGPSKMDLLAPSGALIAIPTYY